MPEQYTDEWWHIQASPLVFPFDDFAEAKGLDFSELLDEIEAIADLPWKEPATSVP